MFAWMVGGGGKTEGWKGGREMEIEVGKDKCIDRMELGSEYYNLPQNFSFNLFLF